MGAAKAEKPDWVPLVRAIDALNRAAQLSPDDCLHGATETVGFVAKELIAGMLKQFEQTEFEFFDFKTLDAAMAVDKLGLVRAEASTAAAAEIKSLTDKKFYVATSQDEVLKEILAKTGGKQTASDARAAASPSWESIDADGSNNNSKDDDDEPELTPNSKKAVAMMASSIGL